MKQNDLRARIEDDFLVNKRNSTDVYSLGYCDGFRAALDLLWPAVEACKFYENSTKLMINVRDLPEWAKSQSIMDNGDRGREALSKIGGE